MSTLFISFSLFAKSKIDEFFDKLDPNIEVIWGISTDTTLGDDAKVTILATGMEDEKEELEQLTHDDRYYEELIPKLYKPISKPVVNPTKETPFVIEPIAEPEPAEKEEIQSVDKKEVVVEDDSVPSQENNSNAMINKWKSWLNSIMQDPDSDE